MRRFIACLVVACALTFGLAPAAFADEALGDVDSPRATASAGSEGQDVPGVAVSSEGDAALADGAGFAMSDFSRAQKGTNRDIAGAYRGYSYLVGHEADRFVQVIATDDYAVVYVPASAAAALGVDVSDEAARSLLKDYLVALDAGQAAGSKPLSEIDDWRFTSEKALVVDAVRYEFDQEVDGGVYAFVIGADGSDLTDTDNPHYLKPSFADFARLADPSEVEIAVAPTWFESAAEFLRTLDWSPLWVTLKTTGVAIVIIFALGLLAAYFCLNISQRAKNIFDSIFTIPMVLPPTVCGFVLLYLCGRNTAFGQFFIDIGFPLIFSWPATVIAAVVVAFPLMYRSALGAFENLDPNMLDAARTLGWSNARIFVKLMLPLSWSSIAAGTVLAFARALGEFGATLFLAGNYLGVTRTIPIAIYFEWMNGNDGVAWFWTAVIIGFSFVVILFINLWSARTTKYRKRELKEEK